MSVNIGLSETEVEWKLNIRGRKSEHSTLRNEGYEMHHSFLGGDVRDVAKVHGHRVVVEVFLDRALFNQVIKRVVLLQYLRTQNAYND